MNGVCVTGFAAWSQASVAAVQQNLDACCYTTKKVYYRYTNTDGEVAQSCEKCLDKVRKMLEDKGLWKPYSN